jgi:hypothetical protein
MVYLTKEKMGDTFQSVSASNFYAILVTPEENLKSVGKLLSYVTVASDILVVLHYPSNGKL